jgi:hypothetical protein
MERLARDKLSSLSQDFVTYGHKKLCNIGPRTQRKSEIETGKNIVAAPAICLIRQRIQCKN